MTSQAERALCFGTIAGEYDRLRPGPPDAAVSWLLPSRAEVVIDLAAGTGLMSRALAARVSQVIAVEPDQRMAAVLRARSPQMTVVEGRGEAIPLPAACADGVFISSAWHWLDPGRALPEIGRVLRGGGRFGAIWTGRDRSVDWLREADLAVRRTVHADDLRHADDAARPDQPGPQGQHGLPAEPGLPGWPRHRTVELPDDAPFRAAATASFSFTRTMTLDDVIGMLATYSGVITASPQVRTAALDRARAMLTARFGAASEIDVPMRSRCWRADRVHRGDGGPVSSGR